MEFNQSINDNFNSFLNISALKEVLIYYKNFYFESKKDQIKKIEDIIKNKKGDYFTYLIDFEIAIEMNKRIDIIKNFYVLKNGNITQEEEMNNAVKIWEKLENQIRQKNIKGIDEIDNIILNNYFRNNNNKESLLKIFNKETFLFFKENNNYYIKNLIRDLNQIVNYFKDFKFETKKNEIILIEEIIKNKKGEYEKYLQNYSEAEFWNLRKNIIYEIYNIIFIDGIKNEKQLNFTQDIWKKLENAIKDNNIENINEEDCFLLTKLFEHKDLLYNIFPNKSINNFKNKNEHKYIMILKEILIYYKEYLFETKKEEIQLIKGMITDNIYTYLSPEILKDYDRAKKMNKRISVINYLFNFEKRYKKSEKIILKVVNIWEEIELIIKDKYITKLKNDNKEVIAYEMNKRLPIIKYLYGFNYLESYDSDNIIKIVMKWEQLERDIKNKNISKINKKERVILYNYFIDIKNTKILLQIFNEDIIEFFINYNKKFMEKYKYFNDVKNIKKLKIY